ncbi:mucin-22-like [Anastrepha obliqua]|uniref:mucin-22-like n=1 Tax=Anastrepha obliqua TaxID=95512 RepID=UPI00240948B5|nr:mucin-22-like [Anastrepha obliqua]
MTSHSQINYDYNNENDALSCNSRPISSTLRRENKNNQFKNHVDSCGNTNIYGTTNGSSAPINAVLHQKSNKTGSEMSADGSDGNRAYRNTYNCGINALILTASATTTIKSSESTAAGSEYSQLHAGSGYAHNDNVNYQCHTYNSYATDTYTNVGGNSRGYSCNVDPICRTMYVSASIAGNTGEFNEGSSGGSTTYTTWENTMRNGEHVSDGRYSALSSTKMLPRLPTKPNKSMLDGMYEYTGGLKVQQQRDDVKQSLAMSSALQLQTAVAARTPQCRMHSQMQVLTQGYGASRLTELAEPATCTTDSSRGDVGLNEQHLNGMASLRLLPQLHSQQSPHVNVLKRQIFEGGNATAITATPTTTTELQDTDCNTYDNTTIKKNYYANCDGNGSKRSERCGSYYAGFDDSKSVYYASAVQRRHTSMSPLDFREFDDYSNSYNNAYSNTDNLSTCSDTPAYTATQAQKQQLQQQRKYAILMAMTTASVIASGETRTPVKRITERTATTLTDRTTLHKKVLPPTTAGKVADEYHYIGMETDLWEWKNERICSNRAPPKSLTANIAHDKDQTDIIVDKLTITEARSTAISEAASVAMTSNVTLTEAATTSPTSAIRTSEVASPTALVQPTTARKLPKRLPTPQYNSDKNNGSRKANGVSKKLPKLPIEMIVSSDSSNTTADMPTKKIEQAVPPIIAKTTSIKSLSTSSAVSSTLPSLAVNTHSKSLTCITSTYVSSYSPSYLSYLSDATTTIASAAVKTPKYNEYLPSSKTYTLILNEEALGTTPTTTIVTASVPTTMVSSFAKPSNRLNVTSSDNDITLSVVLTTGTVTVTTTETSYSPGYSKNSSYLTTYNNNNINDRTSVGYHMNNSNNNNILTSLSIAAPIISSEKKTSITTIAPTYSESLITSELPFYLTSSNISSSTSTSIVADSYANISQPISLPPLYSPSISMPWYTCTLLPDVLPTVSVITTTSRPQAEVTTSPMASTIAFISSEQSGFLTSSKFSHSCSDSFGNITSISNAHRLSSAKTNTSSSVIGNCMSTIFDEYLKRNVDSYHSFISSTTPTAIATIEGTATVIATAAATATNRTTTTITSLLSLASLIPATNTVVTTACASLGSSTFTLEKKLASSTSIVLSSTESLSPTCVLLKSAKTTEIIKEAEDHETPLAITTSISTSNYFGNDSLSSITAPTTISSSNSNGNNNSNDSSGQLLTTTIEPAKKVSVSATSSTKTAFTTTPTSYSDYLTQYQLPVATVATVATKPLSGIAYDDYSINNDTDIANDIKRGLPAYITDFLNCDRTKSNIDITPINIKSTTEDSSAASTPPTLVTATEKVPTTISSTVGVEKLSDALPGATAGFAIVSDVFSIPYSLESTIFTGDKKCVDMTSTTSMAPSVTTLSLASAFDDNFYNSYNVDWTDLTVPVAEESVAATSPVTADSSSYQHNDNAVITSALLSTSIETATSAISTVATPGSIGIGGGRIQDGYFRPTLSITNTDIFNKNSMTTKITSTATEIATTTSASFGVTGKATSVFGGISKGLKGGLDGVLSGVVATTDINAKKQSQQPPKKSGFGFGIASKFVPSVGGLLAGATAAVQQTGVPKAGKSTDTVNLAATLTVATKLVDTGGMLSTATTATDTSLAKLYTGNEVLEDCSSSKNSYDFSTGSANLNKFSDPSCTNNTVQLESTSYDVSGNAMYGQQSHDMMSNTMHMMGDISVDSGDDTIYLQYQQPQLSAKEVASDRIEVQFKHHTYEDGYEAGDVANKNAAVDDEYGYPEYNEYAAKLVAGDDIYNVIYAEQIANEIHIVGADGSVVSTTALFNDNTMTTYYHPPQQINNEHGREQQQGTKFPSSTSSAKKATSSLLPSLTNFAAHIQTQPQPKSGFSNNEMAQLSPPTTATAAKPAGGGGGAAGGMFGSFLGKAAAAVQSATQVVNQATTVVQQKAATSSRVITVTTSTGILPTTATVVAAVTQGYTLMHNNDYNMHQQREQQKLLSHQNSLSSQYSNTTANGDDYENRNLYHYNDNAATIDTVTTTAVDTASQQYANYYLNGNQSQPQEHQSGKLLPAVPPAGSTGKKLPTINTSKSGFLIKQQPTEIYDDDLIADDMNHVNGHPLIDISDEHDELLDDDEIVNELNDNKLDIVDNGELDRYIVDDRIGDETSYKQQSLRQKQPNYDIDSEEANYYMDPQLQMTPSDTQQKLSQHHQRRLIANSYYEHNNGGYDYREDYFNEEDEYKYLEKEQELLYKQQKKQKLPKQKQQQHSYQLDDTSDIYLEENYQSEDSGNYLDESSSGSVVGAAANAKTNKQPLGPAKQQDVVENATVSNSLHTIHSSTVVIADNASGVGASHPHHIKKQDSIIMEEDEDDIMINEVGVSNNAISKVQQSSLGRTPSQDSMIANEDDIMSELPSLSVTVNRNVLMRGETEEVVSGHMHMLRKPEVTAKQRWHWAYNKIIMQLNVSNNKHYNIPLLLIENI